ncbi:hypothetical protein [Sinorhizobium mexicanum]|uniref:Uncharacterized protein n=1 Tax=Sinorhizobium mexicanum TaxID=375549 RepID=A0A859QP36_9HYPH|nr:hypothetical protein [Sinorhizobium mexicanum]MBP1882494.1 hypothetical protein [Sinorhizobium mexicanum]QLL62176.1 hypothetical protein FKV68_12330 [Sinorhizobium mexicanum]
MSVSLKTIVLSSALVAAAAPAFADGYYYVDRAPTGSIYYADPTPDVVYVDPMPTGSIYYQGYNRPIPPANLGAARDRYTNEYQGSHQNDYYLGITPPPTAP